MDENLFSSGSRSSSLLANDGRSGLALVSDQEPRWNEDAANFQSRLYTPLLVVVDDLQKQPAFSIINDWYFLSSSINIASLFGCLLGLYLSAGLQFQFLPGRTVAGPLALESFHSYVLLAD